MPDLSCVNSICLSNKQNEIIAADDNGLFILKIGSFDNNYTLSNTMETYLKGK